MSITVEMTELQYVDPRSNSDKFYRVFHFGDTVVTQYGRNGTFGAFGRKDFADPVAAHKSAQSTLNSKLAKGYERTRVATLAFDEVLSDSALDTAARRSPQLNASEQTNLAVADRLPSVPAPVVAQVTEVAEPEPAVLSTLIQTLHARYGPAEIRRPSVPTRPMLAETVAPEQLSSLICDDNWLAQAKLDGERCVIEICDGELRVLNRQGQPKVKNVGACHVAPFIHLTSGRWVFDGEMLAATGAMDGPTLFLFDMAASPVHDESDPFDKRYRVLQATLGHLVCDSDPVALLGVTEGTEAKRDLLAAAGSAGKEGVMFRFRHARYDAARRSANLLKHKFLHDADCVVVATGNGGKDSVTLGCYDDTGTLREVGGASAIGKGNLCVGDVVEVRFLYVVNAEHPRMFQPRILAKRTDKAGNECSIRQFANAVTDKSA